MAHGSLKEFDPTKESVEDFKERFEFYCQANNVKGEGEHARRKKALFITLLGQETFAKLKVLTSPTPVAEPTLEAIVEHLLGHYRPQTIEIAERFKFFKRVQLKGESIADFMAELRRLAKTCNFGDYLNTAIRDQFVCGLKDTKCQKELLCVPDLTVAVALQKAQAAEAVTHEAKAMQEPSQEVVEGMHKLSLEFKCYRCGKQGHSAAECKHKKTKCRLCLRVRHLARVCQAAGSKRVVQKDAGTKASRHTRKHGSVKLVEVDDNESDSGSEEHLHSIFQLGKESNKYMVAVKINGIMINMEVDSGAERSTIPKSLFEEKLMNVCKLSPSAVSLHQYDHSPLTITGECCADVEFNGHKMKATFVVVDITGKHPLFGRDWLQQLGIDLTALVNQYAMQVHHINHQVSESDRFLDEYADIFKKELGLLRDIEATITVEQSALPRFHKHRPIPFALKDKVEEALQSQVAQGELVPVERAEWAAPIVVVHKKDGGIRICGDFKVSINPVICSQIYPLPTPEEMFSMLANGESFTKLDLARAYKQMAVKKECQHLLTINTHLGLFRYTRLPFGVSTAPALWQKAMAQVLQGLPGVVCFIDDILVTGHTRDEHKENLHKVLTRLRQYGLRLKKSKCKFFQKELEFLGHVISNEGIKPTTERVKSIQDAPRPVNKQELQSFLGLVTYNAKFVPSLSHVLQPLNLLLHKNQKWMWKSAQQSAFDKAKQLLCKPCTLAHYDVKKPIKVYCDASPKGLGACLVHVMPNGFEQPVAYASRSLQPAEQRYAQIEREALGIIFAVRRFHQYLYGRSFTLVTDHRPLCRIFGSKEAIPPLAAAKMQRWALILSAYQYNIECVSGKLNQCADCMSRLPSESQRDSAEKIHSVMEISNLPITASQIAKASAKDRTLAMVITAVQHGHWPSALTVDILPYYRRQNELTVMDGCLLWGRRVIVPQKLQELLLVELHANHIGMSRMKALARSYVWWPQLNSDIEETCRKCNKCLLSSDNPSAAPLHPWFIPKQPWERVHIDHATWGKHLLLVATDVFSKWPEVHLVSSTSAQQTIEKLRVMFATHGIPITIVSDNGPPFASVEFKQFMDVNGVNHRRVPPYHPSSNGAAKNLVKSVKKFLEKADKSASIQTKISRFLASYRNTPHTVTGRTPAEILLGRSPRTRLSLIHPCLSDHLTQKAEANVGKKQPRQFTVNQKVLVRDFRPHCSTKWYQTTVLKRLGSLTYEVMMEGKPRCVHVDHLRPLVDEQEESNNVTDDQATINVTPGMGDQDGTEQVPIISPENTEATVVPHTRCSQREQKPTKRLIEELN